MRGLMGGVAAVLLIAAQFVVLAGTSMGVVRESCLDTEMSQSSGRVEVSSHWTYIVWPPLIFANLDPPGRCVRNSPLREGLSAAGIWELPSPEAQVSIHIEEQLDNRQTP
jgi:hypothetical protein